MSETPDFVLTVQRMQSQIEYLLNRHEIEELEPFNALLLQMKHHWLEVEKLSPNLRGRVEALGVMKVAQKRMKYSWLSRFGGAFGPSVAEQFTVSDLHNHLRDVRNQLASIEFIYKMEA